MRHFYARLLRLYPKTYRQEYGDELQAVFNLSFDEARDKGALDVAITLSRELFNLPSAILYEHLRERRKNRMIRKLNSYLNFSPGSRDEALAAVAPFLLFAAIPILVGIFGSLTTAPYLLEVVLLLAMLVSVPLVFILSFAKGLPRWSLPYLGLSLPVFIWFILMIFGYDLDGLGIDRKLTLLFGHLTTLHDPAWFLKRFLLDGLMWGWVLMIPLTLLLVLFSILIPGLRSFYRNARNDWTLLCFMLYGAAPFMGFVYFEGYENYGLFVVLMFLAMAAAGWLYLRNDRPWTKFLILIGGMTFAMLIAATGQSLLYESSQYREDVSLRTIINWLWLLIIMFIPVAINLLPPVKRIEAIGLPLLHKNT